MKPVSQTAFYCGGIRYWDAVSANPVCGDTYAQYFIDADAKAFLSNFKREIFANYLCACRHRIIDDLVNEHLARNPNLRCILVGAGFDTRAYRLKGGNWLEIDEPAIMEYKEAHLPSSQAKNSLQRIAIDFASETLESKLTPFASTEDTLIIIEGVTMYLPKVALDTLALTLKRLFPNGVVIADFMTEHFATHYSHRMRKKLAQFGATLQLTHQHPYDSFKQAGFSVEEKISLALKTSQFNVDRAKQRKNPFKIGLAAIVDRLIPFAPNTLKEGYAIWVLK